MRSFGNDAPAFFLFQLEGSEDVYKIPLAASLNNHELVMLQTAGEDYSRQVEWLRLFIGDKVDELTPKTTVDIITAWGKASEEQGASPGESKALSE